MKTLFALALWPALAALPALCSAAEQANSIGSGRWLTQSGNLEIEIAPCARALCGTAVKVPLLGKTQIWTRVGQTTPIASLGHAADFVGITAWMNSPPLTMEQLRGKVVLVEFWTRSCINCLRTVPHLVKLYEAYRDRGLVVVGVHTPETSGERQIREVRSAIGRLRIRYPVALDNDYATWNAYRNQFWPATYLIDQRGELVLKHVGETDFKDMEGTIRSLLASNGGASADHAPRASTSL